MSAILSAIMISTAVARAENEVREHVDVGSIKGARFGYDIVIPASAVGHRPAVLFNPRHPTGPDPALLRTPTAGGPWATIMVDGYNVLYTSLSRSSYERVAHRDGVQRKIRSLQALALRDAEQRFGLNADHVVCTGISASGNACWALALHWPATFAGVWPVSAGYVPALDDPCILNLSSQHFYVLHGNADQLISRPDVETAVARARAAGAVVEYVAIDGATHGTFDDTTWEAGLLWAAQQTRSGPSPVPDPPGCGE